MTMTPRRLMQAEFKHKRRLLAMMFLLVALLGPIAMNAAPAYAAACPGGSPLGFPKWYKYLSCEKSTNSDGTVAYTPSLANINDVWLIAAAILELLLRIAALAAIGFVIWGGVQYIISQGEPDKMSKARGTILNALIGLVIAVTSASIVAFIAGRFS